MFDSLVIGCEDPDPAANQPGIRIPEIDHLRHGGAPFFASDQPVGGLLDSRCDEICRTEILCHLIVTAGVLRGIGNAELKLLQGTRGHI